MIEVNLIPGGKKRKSSKGRGGGSGFSLPTLSGPLQDRWILGAAVSWTVVILAMGWIWWSTRAQLEEVDVAVETQVQDSARFAELIRQVEGLLARRDSIFERVDIIQTIDKDRYVWPHVMDEIARALPDFTWLTSMVQVSAPPTLQVSLTGQAGNNFAVAEFMTRLSESPFIQVAELIQTTQEVENRSDGGQQLVYNFTLEVVFEDPPPEVLQMVPLFDEGESLAGTNGS